jgi:transposase
MSKRIILSPPERRVLKKISLTRSRKLEEVRRSRIILGLGSGKGLRQVSREERCSVNTVQLWRDRFGAERLGGLYSRHQGRQPSAGAEKVEARILDWTLNRKPSDESTHWSSRKLARVLGLNHVRVARVWAKAGLQPHRQRHCLSSDDPDFERKAADIIGLYLKPPAHAVVFCVDEKKRPSKRSIGLIRCFHSPQEEPRRHGFEYFRHGTLSLYAALQTDTGQVVGKIAPRHTSAEFVAFLRDVIATQPKNKQIHLIADNLSAHKTKGVEAFLAEHPTVRLHFTPTYSSWLNQVELWFSKIERNLIARGIFRSKADLKRKLLRYICAHNKTAKPFKWTYRNTAHRIR